MMKRTMLYAVVGGMVLLSSCGKKKVVSPPEGSLTGVEAVVDAMPAVATHLGFADRVPLDADLYLTGYDFGDVADWMLKEIPSGEGMTEDPDAAHGMDEAKMYVGSEAFLFVGPGAGGQLQMVGKTYRDFSAAWAGFAAGSVLKLANDNDAELDFQLLSDQLPDDLLAKWLDVIEKDSKFQIPSLVMGWKPDRSKLEECDEAVLKGVDMMFGEFEKALPVAFEKSGVRMEGYEVSGREIFGEGIEQAREELKNQTGAEDLPDALTPERIERLLSSVENLRLTVATGMVDGRMLIYLGNGKDGFRLAKNPAESLASLDELRWTHLYSKKSVAGFAYLSEPMVRSILPWLDSSEYWSALAGAVQPPIREEQVLRQLLSGIADGSKQLAQREASAWSGIVVKDQGWRYESRGGWPDPSLDYETPMAMFDAASGQNPAVQAHWVQNRMRKDLSWKQLEHFGALIEAVFAEFDQTDASAMSLVPKKAVSQAIHELRNLNRAYREEFRAGVGDEVAFIADFNGEVPPVPGISEETIRDFRAPRFVYARPVLDRAMLGAAGKSYVESWGNLTAWAGETLGQELPVIVPQSIESSGLVTWFPPLPFIGGDFVPGVSLNDRVWMVGTSQSMVKGFAKSLESSSPATETGMRIEIDFAPFREWGKELYQMNEAEADMMAGDVPDEIQEIATEENLDRLQQVADQVKGLSYRKWMEDGKPRTRLHLQIGGKE